MHEAQEIGGIYFHVTSNWVADVSCETKSTFPMSFLYTLFTDDMMHLHWENYCSHILQ